MFFNCKRKGIFDVNIFTTIGTFLQNGFIFSGIVYPFDPTPIPVIAAIVCIIVSYLLGSVNSAVLVSKFFFHEDVREKGSGNGGFTNAGRIYGKKAAILTLLGDMLKTALALLLTACVFGFQYAAAISINPFMYISGVACVLGHAYPVFFRFKGGKGVLCTATIGLVLSPLIFAIGLVIFLIVLFGTRYVSLSSMAIGFFYPLLLDRVSALFGLKHDLLSILCAVFLGLFIFYCHRANIRRLLDHCENKVSFGKKDK